MDRAYREAEQHGDFAAAVGRSELRQQRDDII